jgi:hypothetical protein
MPLANLDRLLAAYAGPGYGAAPAAPAYGTQEMPLDSFVVDGRTGNKTTNKDLPAWLRKLGMKGDAYAGGMLKPQIRYGFWYKNGKINFADGTSFSAKKIKGADGKTAYSYTAADGSAKVYDPTDEQDAYNKNYKKATSNQSFFDKVGNTLRFELWKGKDILKNFGVNNAFFGIDPLGVKIGNAVTGRDDKPLVDAFGGATDEDFARYGRATGFAEPIHDVAHTVAAFYGGQGLGDLASAGVSSLSGATSGTNLGIFSNGGRAGMTGVGGGNTGALAASGAIAGGAGTASGTASGVLSGGVSVPGASGTSWMDWVPSLISAGTALVGGKKAGDATTAAAREATAEQRRQFDLVRGDTAGQRALGNAAIDSLARYYGYGTADGKPDMSGFIESPDYQFNLQETQQAVDRSKAAQGGLLSGAAVKEGMRYASNLASRENSAYLDRLMQQAGIGSTGIAQSAAAGANAANNIGGYAINAGNNRANIYQSTAANVNNSIQSGIQNAMLRRYLGQ